MMAKSSVYFKSNLDLVLRTVRENNGNAAAKVEEIAVEGVQNRMLYGYKDVHGLPDNPHTEIVDTGRLFDSITADSKRVSENTITVEVGTDVPYSRFVHEGTRKLKGRPFIVDGISDVRKQIVDAVGTEWKRGF